MFGALSKEIVVNVPASEAWNLYGTLNLPKFVVESVPHVVSKFNVVQGDGGVGTVLELFIPIGAEGATMACKEKFTVVDGDKRLKETEVVEGGFLDLGFTLYRLRIEIAEKELNECVIKSTIEYEVKEEAAANASSLVSIDAVAAVMEAAKNQLEKN